MQKATEAYFHKLGRVVVEVKEPGGDTTGFRKLNAISLDGWPPHARTSEQEDELNTAIMQIATEYVEETGESNRFRVRYVGGPDASGRPLRKYACFKVSAEEDEGAAKGPFPAMPSMPAGLEPWIPVVRWLMSMLEQREQQLMAYNDKLSDKLLDASAQAEPLLKAHGAMSGILEQAIRILFETVAARAGLAENAQLLGGQDSGDGGLQEMVTTALLQFFTNGKAPPSMPGMGPQPPSAPPPGPSAPPPSSPGAPGAGVRFGFDARAGKTTTNPESMAGALVRAVRKLFGSMDGMQLLSVTSALGEAHYESLCAVRAAKQDEAAARAIEAMQRSGGWNALREQIGDAERSAMAEIESLLQQRAHAPRRQDGAEQLLVKNVQLSLGTMDGDRAMELTSQLSASQRAILETMRQAQTDDAAADAVLKLGASLVADGKVASLSTALSEDELQLFRLVHAQAAAHVEGTEQGERPTEAPAKPPGEKVEAVLCLPPQSTQDMGGPLAQATSAWLRGMDGEKGMKLLSILSPSQRAGFQRIRTARTERDVAQAVLAFQTSVMQTVASTGMGLLSQLGSEDMGALMEIRALAEGVLGLDRE
ncbi:MAG: hypothetical protein ACE37F_25350 [Nannocystaceae bacterium]|nr:hypothetical protein [bacterium]